MMSQRAAAEKAAGRRQLGVEMPKHPGTQEGEGVIDSTRIPRAPPLRPPQSWYQGHLSKPNRCPCLTEFSQKEENTHRSTHKFNHF